MLIPKPMPNEFILGHLSRIRKINGLPSNYQVLKSLNFRNGEPSNQRKHTCSEKISSSMLFQEEKHYYRNHTLNKFGLNRDYSYNHLYLPKTTRVREKLWQYNYLPFRQSAFFCSECIHESLSSNHFSFWDRRFQIPGINWCQKHATTVLETLIPEPFTQLPHDLSKSLIEKSEFYHLSSIELDRCIRYTEVADVLLKHEYYKIDEKAYYSEIVIMFHDLRWESLHEKMISYIYTMYPSTWLNKNFPFILKPNSFPLEKRSYPEEVVIALIFAAQYEELSICLDAMKHLFIPKIDI